MKTIPDSNVLFDIILNDPKWFLWSSENFSRCRTEGDLVVDTIIFAEVGGHFNSMKQTQDLMLHIGVILEETPWDAAYAAGRTFRSYRRAGGPRDRLLADFLIGAHAAAKGYRLLTRDAARYRTYFPSVELVTPDTHP